MPYDEKLAARVDRAFARKQDISRKKMFGGICYLYRGNMVCGVERGKLMVRVGPEQYEKALKRKYARPMVFTGRPLKGLVYVVPEGLKTAASLKSWIETALAFAVTLPPK
jgi:TfoX/Sxy family transcriptional regulator of competence genes